MREVRPYVVNTNPMSADAAREGSACSPGNLSGNRFQLSLKGNELHCGRRKNTTSRVHVDDKSGSMEFRGLQIVYGRSAACTCVVCGEMKLDLPESLPTCI